MNVLNRGCRPSTNLIGDSMSRRFGDVSTVELKQNVETTSYAARVQFRTVSAAQRALAAGKLRIMGVDVRVHHAKTWLTKGPKKLTSVPSTKATRAGSMRTKGSKPTTEKEQDQQDKCSKSSRNLSHDQRVKKSTQNALKATHTPSPRMPAKDPGAVYQNSVLTTVGGEKTLRRLVTTRRVSANLTAAAQPTFAPCAKEDDLIDCHDQQQQQQSSAKLAAVASPYSNNKPKPNLKRKSAEVAAAAAAVAAAAASVDHLATTAAADTTVPSVPSSRCASFVDSS